MSGVISRSHVLSNNGSTARLPVANIVCNQTPPVGDKPSLMTFREVRIKIYEHGSLFIGSSLGSLENYKLIDLVLNCALIY